MNSLIKAASPSGWSPCAACPGLGTTSTRSASRPAVIAGQVVRGDEDAVAATDQHHRHAEPSHPATRTDRPAPHQWRCPGGSRSLRPPRSQKGLASLISMTRLSGSGTGARSPAAHSQDACAAGLLPPGRRPLTGYLRECHRAAMSVLVHRAHSELHVVLRDVERDRRDIADVSGVSPVRRGRLPHHYLVTGQVGLSVGGPGQCGGVDACEADRRVVWICRFLGVPGPVARAHMTAAFTLATRAT